MPSHLLSDLEAVRGGGGIVRKLPPASQGRAYPDVGLARLPDQPEVAFTLRRYKDVDLICRIRRRREVYGGAGVDWDRAVRRLR